MAHRLKWPLCGLVVSCGLASLLAEPPTPEASLPLLPDLAAPAKIARAAEANIRQAMQTRVTLAFEKAPLDDAVAALADKGGFRVKIDEVALQLEGIPLDKPVSDDFKNVTIEQALYRILHPLELTWIITDELLLIVTERKATKIMETRLYNVRALERLTPPDEDERQAAAAERRAAGRGMSMLIGGPGFPELPDFQWLLDAILNHTHGPWEEIDGEGGSLSVANNTLMVRQTQRMQDEVAGLLKALEAVADDRLGTGAMAARRPYYPHAEDAAIHAALARPLTVEFIDTPLSAAAAHIAEQIEQTVLLDLKVLEQEGIAADTPITFASEGLLVSSVLRRILEPLRSTFHVHDGALWLTSKIIADEMQFTVVWNIRDLTEAGFDEELVFDLMQETSGPWEEIDGEGGTASVPVPGVLVVRQSERVHREIALVLSDLRDRLAEAAVQADADGPPELEEMPDLDEVVTEFYPVGDPQRAAALEQAITAIIAPDTWQEGAGLVRIVDATLVVRQTRRVQAEIDKFLNDLDDAETARTRRNAGRPR